LTTTTGVIGHGELVNQMRTFCDFPFLSYATQDGWTRGGSITVMWTETLVL